MGTLDPALSSAAREHIDTCDSCRDLVAAVAVSAEAPPPETIGRYQIEKIAGSGAMGIVYVAMDPQLERRIAIKVLRGEAHRDRLLREAKAAAQISHPNVIAVFDAGIADGEVFMAMELVRGVTLREWLEAKSRTWQEVVDVGIAAGRGLAAIHAAGLVHRDVKPDNVLVASDGRIVVTDLGLVRIEPGTKPTGDKLELTQTGALIGTPAYAAPEQLDGVGESDARSDQFSLCVTIYEALAGRRPFEGKTLPELRASIDREVPPLPREVPPAVAAAITRGLAAKPASRWDSIDTLVSTLARTRSPRSRKALVAALVAGVAVAGIGVAIAMRPAGDANRCKTGASSLASIWHPQRRAQLAAAFQQTGVPYAPSVWQSTAGLVDDYSKRVAGAIDDACAATHVRRTQSAAVLDLRTQCLDRRKTELSAVLDLFGKPDATLVDRAPTAVASLVSPTSCADAELLQATEPMPDAPEKRAQVAELRGKLARVEALSSAGKYTEALALARETSTAASSLGYAPLAAEVDQERGRIAIDLQEWDEAKQALDRALLAAERGRHHRIRGDVQLGLAYLALQKDNPAGALEELERADALVTGLGSSDANRARVEDYRGTALAKLGKLDEAKVAAEKAVALYEAAEGKQTISLANPLTQLAFVQYQRGDLPSAVGYLQRALEIQQAAFGPDHPRLGHAHTNLAFNLSAANRLDEAQQHAEAARAVYARSIGETSMPYREATRALVGIQQRRGKFAEAEALARGIVDGIRPRKDTDAVDYSNALEDLAASIVAQQRLADALPLHQEVLTVREKVYPPGHPSIVSAQINIGDVLADLAKCKEALALYEEAQKSTDGPDVPPYLAIAARLGRGRCSVETGKPALAIPPLRDALARNAKPDNPDDMRLRAQTRFVLAQALAATRKIKEARELAKLAADEATELGITPLADTITKWAAALR